MGLLDQHGREIKNGPGHSSIEKHLDASANVFEGIVQIKIYGDAIEGKGKCAHCDGPIEGVLKFPNGYLSGSADREERQLDAKRQMYDKFKRDHYCISRIDGPKDFIGDVLKRFE